VQTYIYMVYAIYKYQTYQFIVLIVQQPSLMVKGYTLFFTSKFKPQIRLQEFYFIFLFSTLDKDSDYL
jgi:hypothetical protein